MQWSKLQHAEILVFRSVKHKGNKLLSGRAIKIQFPIGLYPRSSAVLLPCNNWALVAALIASVTLWLQIVLILLPQCCSTLHMTYQVFCSLLARLHAACAVTRAELSVCVLAVAKEDNSNFQEFYWWQHWEFNFCATLLVATSRRDSGFPDVIHLTFVFHSFSELLFWTGVGVPPNSFHM